MEKDEKSQTGFNSAISERLEKLKVFY